MTLRIEELETTADGNKTKRAKRGTVSIVIRKAMSKFCSFYHYYNGDEEISRVAANSLLDAMEN